MAASNTQEYLALVAKIEDLKLKFVALELENQQLLEDLQKVSIEKQQIHGIVYTKGSTIRISNSSSRTSKSLRPKSPKGAQN
jgi:hypothetical protein